MTNIQIWLAAITLAREIVKYFRETNSCTKKAKTKVETVQKAFKTKNKKVIEAAIKQEI